MAALRQMSAAHAHVIRDGTRQSIAVTEIVPGDIILIEEGDTIPADARLMQSTALQTAEAALTGGRCFRAVDSMSEESPNLIAIEEETDHQIMHGGRCGKANRATYEPLDPSPQIDVFALDGLRVPFAHCTFLRVDLPPIGTPAIGVKPHEAKRLQ